MRFHVPYRRRDHDWHQTVIHVCNWIAFLTVAFLIIFMLAVLAAG